MPASANTARTAARFAQQLGAGAGDGLVAAAAGGEVDVQGLGAQVSSVHRSLSSRRWMKGTSIHGSVPGSARWLNSQATSGWSGE
ncbi:hypothetical protein CGZ69_35935 [Streptomyces peucetius subsp. caesius ATCC 27952]|nr:hypothetical protein CGZ69_35935 [Streptomyces peucetius subsp. caesius ATCC 27952]